MKWYEDEPDARYQTGNPEAEEEIYTDTNQTFGLHGELSKEHQKLAENEAKLIITNNICKGRGGGIASNSPIVIGVKNADVGGREATSGRGVCGSVPCGKKRKRTG